MKCVGYDHEFVEDLKTRNEIWKKNPKKVIHDINPSKSAVAGSSSSSSTAPVLRRTGKDRRSTALVSAPVTAGLRRSTRQRSSINYVDDNCDNARVHPSDVASAENDRLISDLTQEE